MTWMRVDQTLRHHAKVIELAARLSIPTVLARGHLVTLWLWCLEQAPDGQLDGISDLVIEAAAEWSGPRGHLVTALCETRLLDATGRGYAIHDWMDYAEGLRLAGRKAEERERKRTVAGMSKTVADTSATVADASKTVADPAVTVTPDETRRDGDETDRGSRACSPSHGSGQAWASVSAPRASVAPSGAPHPSEAPVRAQDRPGWPDGVCTEAEWLDLWTTHCAGRGRLPGAVLLSGLDRVGLQAVGQPASWWAPVLRSVAESPHLRGERSGWVATPSWLLRRDNAGKVQAGHYSDAPPEAEATPEEVEEVAAWLAGWSTGAGAGKVVARAEPPSARTVARDKALLAHLRRWRSSPSTEAWATARGAELAARALAADARSRETRAPSLDRMLTRDHARLDEAMRAGDAIAPVRAPAPESRLSSEEEAALAAEQAERRRREQEAARAIELERTAEARAKGLEAMRQQLAGRLAIPGGRR